MRYLSKLAWFKRNKKKSVIIFVAILLVAVIFRPKAPKPVPTTTVTRGDITQVVSASGTVFAASSVNLSFLTGGKLTYLGVKNGDEVKQYQTIAVLDQRSTQKNLENALIDYSKQRNTFDSVQDSNGNTKPESAANATMRRILENNQNDLNKAVNSVELQSLAKEQSVLTSPIAGVVTRADVSSSGVNVGPTTTFTIADTSNLIFKADVDESDIGKIVVGQIMKITLDAFPDTPVNASVESIDVASHATSTGGNAYTVQATIPAGALAYRIGMNGDSQIVVAGNQNVITIPLSSLIDDTHIYVQKGKSFEKRQIRMGIQSDTEAEVVSGLKVGDKVALTPDDVEKAFPKLKSQ
ncbi:efflux RND transporter periplasmic adaptor subunit [soil metagenome]